MFWKAHRRPRRGNLGTKHPRERAKRGRGRPLSGKAAQWLAALEVGSSIRGKVVNRVSYGVFVNIGPINGLCHLSQLGKGESIGNGESHSFEVLSVDLERGRVSLRFLGEAIRKSGIPVPPEQRAAGLATGLVVGDQNAYGRAINQALEKGVKQINSVGQQFAASTAPQRTGFVTEADHTATFNVGAAFKRSEVRAYRLASTERASPDIALHSPNEGVVKEASLKVFKTPQKTAAAQRGYGEQQRVIPKDQLRQAKQYSKHRASAEHAKGRPNRTVLAMEHEEVFRQASDRVCARGVESMPRTRKESAELAEKAKRGTVKGRDIVGGSGKRVLGGAKAGVRAGAIGGAAASAACEMAGAACAVYRGEKRLGEAARNVAVRIGIGTVDGAVKGAAGGAAGAAAKVAACKVGSQALKGLLKGNAPAAAATVGVDVARHAISLAAGSINLEQFRQAAMDSVRSGAGSYVGSALGGLIGGPAGMLIGGVVGSYMVSKASEAGIFNRLGRLFSSETTGYGTAESLHFQQKRFALEWLASLGATVFPDRVTPTGRGSHLSAGAVLASGKKIFVMDFRAWRGILRFQPETNNGVVQQEVESGGGNTYYREHRNPMNRLYACTMSLKQWLSKSDDRWRKIYFAPVVVFCGEVELGPSLKNQRGFLTQTDFQDFLSQAGHSPTPSWVLDGLATTPTWDVLTDPSGLVYQGIIQNPSFRLQVEDGRIEVPYLSILKVDVEAGGFMSRSDNVLVTLRDGERLRGLVEKEEVTLSRMGHRRTFLLRDLLQICPSSSFFCSELASVG